MSEVEVLAPGLLTTVQDLGREGFGAMGVSPSGAADSVSLRIGNRLVDNAEGAAALEMTLLGGTFRFVRGAIVALAGSDFGASLDGAPIVLWRSLEVRPGQTLIVGPTRSGARCYLCVQGGIAVKPFLGSASTHLLSGLGGYEGRALRKGDVLTIDRVSRNVPKWQRYANPDLLERLAPRKSFRVTPGPQSDWFAPASETQFFTSAYRVAEESDRTGLRLEGNPVTPQPGREMITEGVSLGAVQVPPSGQPIIVFVEQQTTGGYPKLANVISADLASLGQLRPRDEIRFERIDFDVALALFLEQEKLLTSPHLIIGQ